MEKKLMEKDGGSGITKDNMGKVYVNNVKQKLKLARYFLADCYEKGSGVVVKDLELYTLLALILDPHEDKFSCEENNIGYCYEYGKEVDEYLKKAFDSFTIAANAGNSIAQNNLAAFYKNGTVVERKNLKKAFELYTLAANQGNLNSIYNLGYFYQYSIGVKKDINKAIELYTLAANQGYSKAQYQLSECYKYGRGVETNIDKAIELLTLAANQGHSDAQFDLAVCYALARGVEKNDKKAVELYTLDITKTDGELKRILNYIPCLLIKIMQMQYSS